MDPSRLLDVTPSVGNIVWIKYKYRGNYFWPAVVFPQSLAPDEKLAQTCWKTQVLVKYLGYSSSGTFSPIKLTAIHPWGKEPDHSKRLAKAGTHLALPEQIDNYIRGTSPAWVAWDGYKHSEPASSSGIAAPIDVVFCEIPLFGLNKKILFDTTQTQRAQIALTRRFRYVLA